MLFTKQVTAQALPVLLCALYLLATPGTALQLTGTPTELSYYGDESFQLDCFHSDGGASDIVTVTEIRIIKQNPQLRRWEDVARWTTKSTGTTKSVDGFQVTGKIGDDPKDWFLTVLYANTTSANAGVYRCDLTGTDSWNSYAIEKSNSVSVVQLEPTTAATTTTTTSITTTTLAATTPKPSLADTNERVQAEIDALRQEYDQYRLDTEGQITALTGALRSMDDAVNVLVNPEEEECNLTPELKDELVKSVDGSALGLVSDNLDSLVKSRMDSCGCDVSGYDPVL